MHRIEELTKADKAQNTRIYDMLARSGIEDGWYGRNKKFNFEQMIKIADYAKKPLADSSVLDVGCGTGDFSAFVANLGVTNYTGIDIYEPSLKKARQKYPRRTFLLTDILTNHERKQYDYVFCSGALTVKLPKTDNYDFLAAMVQRMYALAKAGLVFNFLTDKTVPDEADVVFYYNPEKVANLCRSIAPKAQIRTAIAKMQVPEPFSEWQAHVYMY